MSVNTKTLPPGAGAPINGPSWSVGRFDTVRLPSGKTISDTSNEELRGWLAKVGVAGAHTDGRDVIVERYAAILKKVHDGRWRRCCQCVVTKSWDLNTNAYHPHE